MRFEPKDWRYMNGALALGLLALYFSRLALLGMDLAVPYAFLWFVYVLNAIKEQQRMLNENLKKYAPTIPAE